MSATETISSPTFAAEWYPQSGVMLTWPHKGTDWAYMLDEVTKCYVEMAREIARRERLIIVAADATMLEKRLTPLLSEEEMSRIYFAQLPTNDTWVRDYGCLTLVGAEGNTLLDFRFNGWGGKFAADLDNAVNHRLVTAHRQVLKGIYADHLDLELEGGSVETDGRGTLLTTSECLLNPNRSPWLDKEEKEDQLRARLGVSRILWLDHGALAGDDTDSHIDTLARLCPNDTILYVKCYDPEDEHFSELDLMEQQLATFLTSDGRPYRLVPLPLPRAIYDEEGERLPATYANYLVMNTAVLYPTYGQSDLDAEAAQQIKSAFPDRETVGIDCRALIKQHGSLHCSTMQFPEGVIDDGLFQNNAE